jgi:hypothetical protein
VQIGTNETEFWLRLALLWDDVWVQNTDCSNCKPVFQQYEAENSTSSVFLNTSCAYSNPDERMTLQGWRFEDVFNLSDFELQAEFCSAEVMTDPFSISEDGILGLGKTQNSIVGRLFEQEMIDLPSYSLYNSAEEGPVLLLGSVNFTSLGLEVVQEAQFGIAEKLAAGFRFNEVEYQQAQVEFTSLLSFMFGPLEIIQAVYAEFISSFGCYYFEEFLVCDCGGEFSEMVFTINNQTFAIPPEHYLMPATEGEEGSACFLYLLPGGTSWVLGEPFLKTFFTTVDLSSSVISFAQVAIIEVYVPSTFETYLGWAVLLGSVGVSFVIYILAAGIYQLVKKRMEDAEQPLLDPAEDSKRTL